MSTPLYSSETWTLREYGRYRITATEKRSETNRSIHALQLQKKARYSERNKKATGFVKKNCKKYIGAICE
jgi:hypothetical protein